MYHWDSKPLLKTALTSFFVKPTGFVDMCIEKFPSPLSGAEVKVKTTYSGDQTTELFRAMTQCDRNAALMVSCVKMYNKPDCTSFDVFGRVMSGSIAVGDRVKVLGEAYAAPSRTVFLAVSPRCCRWLKTLAPRLGPARRGAARLGSARLGSARLGSARLGSARLSTPWPGLAFLPAG